MAAHMSGVGYSLQRCGCGEIDMVRGGYTGAHRLFRAIIGYDTRIIVSVVFQCYKDGNGTAIRGKQNSVLQPV